jgi:hypothetical protein
MDYSFGCACITERTADVDWNTCFTPGQTQATSGANRHRPRSDTSAIYALRNHFEQTANLTKQHHLSLTVLAVSPARKPGNNS